VIDLSIETRVQGAWTIVQVAGEVDLATAASLRDGVLAAAEGPANVAIDLTEVSFIDSSGLGAIVACLKRLRERGGDLTIVAPDDSAAAKLLALTGLDTALRRVVGHDALT
jgi:anti-sigma B factor antagonist